jgi:hypothetical protein
MDDTQLTADDIRVFEAFYQKRLAEAGPIRDDAEELAVARQLLDAAMHDGLTPMPDGSVANVRRHGGIDWTDEDSVEAAADATNDGNGYDGGGGNGGGRPTRRGRSKGRAVGASGNADPKDMIVGVLMVVAAIGAAIWFFTAKLGGGGTKPHVPPTAIAATTTGGVGEDGDLTPTPMPTVASELLGDVMQSSGVKTDMVAPKTLDVQGTVFVVQPVAITTGEWPVPEDPRVASWVFGTFVNYVFGIQATDDNVYVLATLKAGDELVLRQTTGSQMRFALTDAIKVPPQTTEIFKQSRPGLTLVLLGGGEDDANRVVFRAVYIPNSNSLDDAMLDVAMPGTPVQVSKTMLVSCLEGYPTSITGAPQGYVYYAVDYLFNNAAGEKPASLATMAHHIKDSNGLAFPPVQVSASGKTHHPCPGATIVDPGGVVTNTAVYAVPEDSILGDMTWSMSVSPVAPPAQFRLLPYSGELHPHITVSKAERQGTNTYTIDFMIQSPAFLDTQVMNGDVQVQGGTLLPGGTEMPLSVPANNSGVITLVIQSGGGGAMQVGILGQMFQITEG